MSGRILVAGSINSDIILSFAELPKDDGTVIVDDLFEGAGGHGANCASAIAALGGKPSLLGRVGHDRRGLRLVRELELAGIDVAGIGIDRTLPTGRVIIPSSPDFRCMMMHRGANDGHSTWSDELARASASPYDAMVVMDPCAALLEQLPAFAHKNAINHRVWAPGGIWAASPQFHDVKAQFDLIIMNAAEYASAFGEKWSAQADLDIVVTEGRKGAWLLPRGSEAILVPAQETAVGDATGAGDAFIAALVTALTEPAVSLVEAIAIANRVAVLNVGALGPRSGHSVIGKISGELMRAEVIS